MTIWDAIILGTVQGLTEFLPVSSSGHLVLTEHFLGIAAGDLSFEVAVHLGTLVAVFAYFRGTIARVLAALVGRSHTDMTVTQGRLLLVQLLMGTIPAAVVGLLWKSEIEALFGESRLAAVFLVVTGVWLLSMRWRPIATGRMTWWRALLIGTAQAVAILPGISRSGSTIATGTLIGVHPSQAAEFSFLLSIPAILGASLLSIPDAAREGVLGAPHIVGALLAGTVGYAALRWVFASIRRGRFSLFGVYCLLVGMAGVVWL